MLLIGMLHGAAARWFERMQLALRISLACTDRIVQCRRIDASMPAAQLVQSVKNLCGHRNDHLRFASS